MDGLVVRVCVCVCVCVYGLHASFGAVLEPSGATAVGLAGNAGLRGAASECTDDARRMSNSLALPALMCRACPLYSTLRARRSDACCNSAPWVSAPGDSTSSSSSSSPLSDGDRCDCLGESCPNSFNNPSLDLARLGCRTTVACRAMPWCHVSSLGG